MKKRTSIFAALFLCFFLTACNSSEKSAYTAEFPYVPAYSSAMELQSFTPNVNNSDYSVAVYKVKNTNNEDIINQYEKILLEDGWTVTEDQKPISVTLSKDEHRVLLLPQEFDGYVDLHIVSK